MAKTRFVRVRLDFVLDMERELETLPHELMALTLAGNGAKMITEGLRAVVPLKHHRHIALVPGVRFTMGLHKPRRKK
jgi:hypothetical protein